jgi:anti-sigma B factor antagonist
MTHPANHPTGSNWDNAWFRVAPRTNCCVVTAGGEVDMDSAAGLDRALKSCSHHSPCLVVDLTAVTFVDSTALGVLIGARRRAQQGGGQVLLVNPPSLVRRLLTGTQLQQSFVVYETLDEALSAIE